MKFYNLSYDLIFKHVFKEPRFVCDFLNKLLDTNFIPDEITVNDTEISGNIDIKTSNLDVLLTVSDKYLINMEMEKNKKEYDINYRIEYYFGKLITESILKGESYEKKKDVIVIFISEYNINKRRCIEKIRLKNEENKTYLNDLIIKIDLTKIDECSKIEVRKWLDLIELSEERHVLKGDGSIMDEVLEKILALNNDEQIKEYFRLKEKSDLDYISNMEGHYEKGHKEGLEQGLEQGIEIGHESGLKEGIEQGLKEGHKEGLIEVAKNMLDQNLDIKLISKVTGISIEEINKLALKITIPERPSFLKSTSPSSSKTTLLLSKTDLILLKHLFL